MPSESQEPRRLEFRPQLGVDAPEPYPQGSAAVWCRREEFVKTRCCLELGTGQDVRLWEVTQVTRYIIVFCLLSDAEQSWNFPCTYKKYKLKKKKVHQGTREIFSF